MSSPTQPTQPLRDTDLPAKDLTPGASTGTATGTAVDQPPVDLDTEYTRATTTTQITDQSGDSSGDARDKARQTAEETLHKVRDFTRDAGDKANEQWQQARQQFDQARQQLGEQWHQQRENFTRKAHGMVSQQKDRATNCVADMASATRAAADELRGRNDETIAGYAEAAATQLEHLKDYLRHAEVNDLTRDVAGFARRRPEWFLGGAFVAGLAVARFLKADDRHRHPRELPEGADPALFDDLVEQQHPRHAHGDAYSDPYGNTGRSTMPGMPTFGEEAPFAVGTMPGDEPLAGDEPAARAPGASFSTPSTQPEIPDVTPPTPSPTPGASTTGMTGTNDPAGASGTTGGLHDDPLTEPRDPPHNPPRSDSSRSETT